MANKRTHKEFIALLSDEFLNKYKILDAYESSHKKVRVIHKVCGREYLATPVSLLSGKQCKKCSDKQKGLKRKATHEDFVKKVYELVGEEYAVLSEYTYSRIKIKMRHNSCNHEYEVTPNNFTSKGRRCPKCFGKPKRTQEQFIKEVYDLVGDEYSVIGHYITANDKISMKHNKCGNVYNVTPSMFTNDNNRCPQCVSSKGELTVKYLLENLEIPFKREQTFKDLIGIGGWYLRFDFSILGKGNSVICLIEYDGEFHYKDYFKDNQYERTKEHDIIKNKYCEDNNIPLLRIPYWEFNNIDKIVIEFLNEQGIEVNYHK